MKAKALFMVVLIMVVLVLSAGSLNFLASNAGLSESRKMLVMRNIGHRVLLSSGDSVSRVLPVRKLDDHTFLIEFENRFTFLPDSLIQVVRKTLLQSDFPANYVVHVMSCADRSIVYGFEMNDAQSNLLPCIGRVQPFGCYAIQLSFSEPLNAYHPAFLLGFTVIGLALIGFVTFRAVKKPRQNTSLQNGNFLMIGTYRFYPGNGLLQHTRETFELSRKETALLSILAEGINELVLRDRLLKEVWEDEGVITGRSLDVFISKLRKKLHHDPAVNIVNVHGKGYRLEA